MGISHRLQLQVVDSNEEFYKLKLHWNKILNTYEECPPFLTWEWMYTWWKVYKTSYDKLKIIVVSDADKIVGIAPFYIKSILQPIPHRCLYFLGTGEDEDKEVCSEYLDIIAADSIASIISKEIISYFSRNTSCWDKMYFSRVLHNSNLIQLFMSSTNQKILNNSFSLCGYRYQAELPEKWEDYLSSLNASMRQSIRNAKNKLLAISNYKVGVVDDRQLVYGSFQMLKDLHTTSWHLKGKSGAFTSAEFCEFHQRIAEIFHKNNMLELLVIKVGNTYVSILYNFKIKNTMYYYQSGFNLEEYSYLSPGVLAHSECIKRSIEEKIKYYDFMMGDASSYKRRFGCRAEKMYTVEAYSKSLVGKIINKLDYFF